MQALTFPFNTCEESGKLIAQPYSASVNVLSCIILLIMAIFYAKTPAVRLLLVSFILFQAYHAYSHMKWDRYQATGVHLLSYFAAGALVLGIWSVTGHLPFMPAVIVVFLVDLVLFLKMPGSIYSVYSGLLLWTVIVLTGIWGTTISISPEVRRLVPFILALFVVLLGLILNEKYNCEAMMKVMPLPYHVAIEVVGLILFSAFGYLFLLLEAAVHRLRL